MSERERRKLAAILAADVVGYSTLMEADETSTFARLKTVRASVFDPAIAAHGGRVFKTTGDGLLAEFASAVEAVSCAIDVQQALRDDAAADAADCRLSFRIGVNVGDAILDGEDVLGDSVNVAARLEGLATAGGICVSDAVREHIGGKLKIGFSDGGERQLKNIERPVRVWHWAPGQPEPDTSADRRFGRWRPSIAVLPFENISGDPEQDYFADGLTEDLITALTHWRSFPVVARNSTFTYKGRTTSVPQIARELGASYIVEGSVRKAGRRVRISAQLVDGATGHHVWADRYDRELDDIFDLQDELTHRIAAVLAPEVRRTELKRSAAKRPNDLGAWDHYLRGEAALAKYSENSPKEAQTHFEKAIDLDPDYSDAYTGLAQSHYREVQLQTAGNPESSLERAIEAANRAIELDPESSHAHFALSTAYILRNEHNIALAEARLAVELNPNDPVVLHALGNKSDLAGDPEGIARMELAQQLNPRDPGLFRHQTFLARAYANVGDYEAAIDKARAAIGRQPDYAPAHFILAIALALTDRNDEAAAALRDCEDLSPGFVARRADWRPYTDDTCNARLRDGLTKATAAANNSGRGSGP